MYQSEEPTVGDIIGNGLDALEGMVRVGVRPSKPIDTTGAGDLYSAGFIYGHMQGMPPEICGKIGAILAGRVIELIGAKMDESNWEKLRREIHSLMD